MATASKSTKKAANSTGERFTKATYLKWYREMLLMRKFEEKCGQLYIQQKFGGFCHLYIGQEAVLSGMMEAIKPTDKVITAYRDHAHPLVMGSDPNRVMAELYGRSTGLSKGKGGSMHMFDKERNLFGGHGIVGAQIPMGAGIAFADKYRGEDHVTVCFFGDGAARQGALYETFNMAMTWKIPCIFVIENNGYGLSTPTNEQYRCENLADRGIGYGMESHIIDGNNILEVYTKIAELKEKKSQLHIENEEMKFTGQSKYAHSQRTLEEFEAHLKESETAYHDAKQKYERALKILLNANAGVQHLADKLDILKGVSCQIIFKL